MVVGQEDPGTSDSRSPRCLDWHGRTNLWSLFYWSSLLAAWLHLATGKTLQPNSTSQGGKFIRCTCVLQENRLCPGSDRTQGHKPGGFSNRDSPSHSPGRWILGHLFHVPLLVSDTLDLQKLSIPLSMLIFTWTQFLLSFYRTLVLLN